MKRINRVFIGITILVLLSCVDKESRNEFVGYREINNARVGDLIYVERFRVKGYGVFGGNLESCWLTDSNSFRIFIDTEDDRTKIIFSIKNDTIFVQKHSFRSWDKGVLKEWEYSITELKR